MKFLGSKVLLGLGSNLGDRANTLNQAILLIAKIDERKARCSSVIETAAEEGCVGLFLNQAIVVETKHNPLEFLEKIQSIELMLGRTRLERHNNRTLDIDILLWQLNGKCLEIKNESLEVPHPRMLERTFVLKPSSEIAGSWVHPKTNKNLCFHLEALNKVH